MIGANKNILKSPGGMKTYLPELAVELKDIEEKILDVFNLWGYQTIITPTLEYYESLRIGMGSSLDKKLYKFIDYEGNIMALRPEMTAPIARSLSSRLNEVQLPLRLSYSASVFRYDQPQTGKNREIFQLGVEFIGENNYLADAEAVILAIESLKNTGLKDFKIDIGHAGFLNGVIVELGLEKDIEYKVKGFLNTKDLVGLNNYIDEIKIEGRDLLKRISLLRGNLEVLEDARSLVKNPQSLEAINNLFEIYKYIDSYGFAEYITFDLGMNRGFDYYTGVVFEGFTEKLGYNICGGGRYDSLLGKYSGNDQPAIGFAIGIERVRLALKRQDRVLKRDVTTNLIIYNKGCESLALKTAKKLHSNGILTLLNSAENQEIGLDFNRELNEGDIIQKCLKSGNKAIQQILFFKDQTELIVRDLSNKKKEHIFLDRDWEGKLWEI